MAMSDQYLPSLSLQRALLIPALSGTVVSLIYRKYEVEPTQVAKTALLLALAPVLSSSALFHHQTVPVSIVIGCLVFYISLLANIFIYRISPWHPLAKYPGPFWARVSQFWLAKQTVGGKWPYMLKELHSKLGPCIRVGPNLLSFIDASLIPAMMGPNGMPKGPQFDGSREPGQPPSLVTIRNVAEHTERRKTWAKILSASSVRDYIPIITRRALELADHMEKRAGGKGSGDRGEVVDLSSWLGRFAFDFMGDMSFGGGFNLMRDGDVHGFWTIIEENMRDVALLQRLPWLGVVALRLPSAVGALKRFNDFVKACVNARRARGPLEKDLFYILANEEEGPAASPDLRLLVEDSKLAIVAGSDTAATTLANVFFSLMTNIDIMKRLRTELDAEFPPGEGDPFDFVKLSELPLLNAVINEALRLYPPVPTDLQRAPEKGSGSKQIGDHILPEGCAVFAPPYVIQRQERYFSPSPDSFLPDRWLQSTSDRHSSAQVESHELGAFIPFSYGPANCAGKMLAMAEMRVVIALLLQKFDFSFAEGYDTTRWEKEIGYFFVLKLGELPVVLTKRF